MSKYCKGKELYELLQIKSPKSFPARWISLSGSFRAQLNAIADFVKFPKPPPPSHVDVYRKWETDYSEVTESTLLALMNRLNRNREAHEEYKNKHEDQDMKD